MCLPNAIFFNIVHPVSLQYQYLNHKVKTMWLYASGTRTLPQYQILEFLKGISYTDIHVKYLRQLCLNIVQRLSVRL